MWKETDLVYDVKLPPFVLKHHTEIRVICQAVVLMLIPVNI